MLIIFNINNFFEIELTQLNCQEHTKAYIISILSKYKTSNCDYSRDSLTLMYDDAKNSRSFYKFQNLADWIFFAGVFFPQNLKNASKEYYYAIGQLSYYNCYKLINKQLNIYEELSDNFIKLNNMTHKLCQPLLVSFNDE